MNQMLSKIICALFALSFCCSAFAEKEIDSIQLNGDWWQQATSDERIGSLYALVDCLAFDASPGLFFIGTFANDEKNISSEYGSGKVSSSASVIDVFKQHHEQAKSLSKDAERYGEEFWRAHKDAARRGYLEGYVSCMAYLHKNKKYPGTVSAYVDKLNDLYNVDDHKGENAPEYDGPVASAIEQARKEIAK